MFAKARKTFEHGIHVPDNKDDTQHLSVRQFPFAPLMVISLSQHAGKPAVAVVREGQEVVRGQLLAKPDGFMSVALHAPVSGVVKRIALAPAANGQMQQSIFLQPFPASGQEVVEGEPVDVKSATADEILSAIQMAGVVGLGGAAFPTHVKLKVPAEKSVDTLIINGVECEPYLTTDHRVMLEQAEDIFMGIRYLKRIADVQRVIIGIEANKPDAARHLSEYVPDDLQIEVQLIPVKYPQGAEKMLITALLGREVPSGGLPLDVHALVVNVATTAEIGRLLPHGRGIQERVITIGGPGVKQKGNYWVPVGTPLRFALEEVGLTDDATQVFLGGPMMGQAVSNLDVPITKGTSGVTVFTEKETGRIPEQVFPCIHCAYCVDACPLFLNPSQLGILAKNAEYQIMQQQYHLMDCFECGSCSYVCPSNIPLVQYFRVAKRIIREQKAAS